MTVSKPAADANAAGPVLPLPPPNMTNEYIGTQIDCTAAITGDGRYELNVSIEDSSAYVDDKAVQGASRGTEFPILRSFRSSNQLVLADGQSAQFSVATDRITGEIIRAELTLRVLK